MHQSFNTIQYFALIGTLYVKIATGSYDSNTFSYDSKYRPPVVCLSLVIDQLDFAAYERFNSFFQFYLFRFDYLKISNENNQTFGKYCGQKNGQSVYVTGRYAVISFHSDGSVEESGYRLTFYFYSKCNHNARLLSQG